MNKNELTTRYKKNSVLCLKKISALLLFACLLLCLVACGNNNETNTSDGGSVGSEISSEKETDRISDLSSSDLTSDVASSSVSGIETAGEGSSVNTNNFTDSDGADVPASGSSGSVESEKMKNDLIAKGGNCFYLNNQATYLDVNSIEIQRRKSDAKNDEVHVSAVLGDAYYSVTADYILYYSYYDVGGWCLDNYVLSEFQSRAVASPVSDGYFISYMQNHFSSCSITNRTQTIEPTGTYTDTVLFTATLDYEYLSVKFSGWYVMQFYDNVWHDSYDFEIVAYDWSAFKGTFQYRNLSLNMGAGFYSADVKVTFSDVEQISEKKLRVTYSASVYLFDKSGGYIEEDSKIAEKTTNFSISTERITILGKEIVVPQSAGCISLPWYGTFNVYLYRNDGVEANDGWTSGTKYSFSKVISTDDLQGAIDDLKDLNGQNL